MDIMTKPGSEPRPEGLGDKITFFKKYFWGGVSWDRATYVTTVCQPSIWRPNFIRLDLPIFRISNK